MMRMLTAEPAIAVKRILDKKTGKPLRPVTRENIVDEVRFVSGSLETHNSSRRRE